jgi:hypothetical protein
MGQVEPPPFDAPWPGDSHVCRYAALLQALAEGVFVEPGQRRRHDLVIEVG